MKIKLSCGYCGKKFIGGSTHRRYCLDCRKNHRLEIQRAVANRKLKPCPGNCGKMISQDAAHCRSCARKALHKTVEVHCDLCKSRFLPKSWRQAAGARVLFCGNCKENRAVEVRKIAWAARKRKGAKANLGGTSDRRLLRLIAEAQGSVTMIFDREKNIGKIPANLLARYPALASEGSIPSTPPPRRSHHAKVAPAPRVKRTRAHPKVLSIAQFIEKRAQVQNDYRENVG